MKKIKGQKARSNEDVLRSEFECWVDRETIPSIHSFLLADQPVRGGIIISEPDQYGFFMVRNTYRDEDELYCVIGRHDTPSLYRGSLLF